MTLKWKPITEERDGALLLSETAVLELPDGLLYRTVIYQAPATVAVSLIHVAKGKKR